MPELPEVETIVRGLRKALIDRTIEVIIHCSPHLKKKNSRGFPHDLIGRRVISIDRTGKNIFINFDDNSMMWVHLRMTGQFLLELDPDHNDRHNHLILKLNGKSRIIIYRDVRKFGQVIHVHCRNRERFLKKMRLGKDAMVISKDEFQSLLKAKNRMIKPLLLDQSLLAGLGNIYVDEILFKSRIHPCRISSGISIRKLNEMYSHMRMILNSAISNMGTTFDSFAGVDSEPGNFQAYLLAYNRAGCKCLQCGRGRIKRIVVAQRGTYICSNCQRK